MYSLQFNGIPIVLVFRFRSEENVALKHLLPIATLINDEI